MGEEEEKEKGSRRRRLKAMVNFLCLSVRYLSRTYEGEEWPPSPARLFQALIAGAKLGEHQKSWKESEEALRWFQSLGPPTIVCSQGVRGEEYLSYGPLNQIDRLIPSRGRPSVEALPPFGIHPSFVASPPKESKKGKSHWTNYLEGIRHRPTILLDEQPAVHYLWRLDRGEDLARRICKLAEWMIALGWGTDLVVGEGKIISEEEAEKLYGQRLIPTEHPQPFERRHVPIREYHVPSDGFLELVLERFEKKRFDERRSSAPEIYSGRVTRTCTYRNLSESWGPIRWYIPFALFHPQENRRIAFGVHRWTEIVAWTRHAVAEKLRRVKSEDWISKHILGHGGNGAHVCFVPLPSLPYDGLVRRLMIIGQESEVYKILRGSMKDTLTLVEEGTERPVARLKMLEIGEDRYLDLFVSSGETWITVSPLILHGHDYRNKKYSFEKTQRLILQALQESGYDVGRIRRMWFQKSPLLAGVQHVLEYRVPAHLKPWPRYHVGVEFEGSVLGPVIAGIGQHYGFGTFLCETRAEEERV